MITNVDGIAILARLATARNWVEVKNDMRMTLLELQPGMSGIGENIVAGAILAQRLGISAVGTAIRTKKYLWKRRKCS